MADLPDLRKLYSEQLSKALRHLAYSYNKVLALPPVSDSSKDEELEVWESFASRFARCSDIYIAKVLRLQIRDKDPAFRGSVVDLLNEAEKFGLIGDARAWRRIRELRNVAAHEYAVDTLTALYSELVKLCPCILAIKVDLCA